VRAHGFHIFREGRHGHQAVEIEVEAAADHVDVSSTSFVSPMHQCLDDMMEILGSRDVTLDGFRESKPPCPGISWSDDMSRALSDKTGEILIASSETNVWNVVEACRGVPHLLEWIRDWSVPSPSSSAPFSPNTSRLSETPFTSPQHQHQHQSDDSPRKSKRARLSSPVVMECEEEEEEMKFEEESSLPFSATPSFHYVFRFHSSVLASRCFYFQHLFDGTFGDARRTWLRMDASPAALACFARYVYCGFDEQLASVLESDPNLCLELLSLANRYGIEGLQLRCEWKILSKITRENALSFLRLPNAPLVRATASFLTLKHEMYGAAIDLAVKSNDHDLLLDVCSHHLSWQIGPSITSAFPDESPEPTTR